MYTILSQVDGTLVETQRSMNAGIPDDWCFIQVQLSTSDGYYDYLRQIAMHFPFDPIAYTPLVMYASTHWGYVYTVPHRVDECVRYLTQFPGCIDYLLPDLVIYKLAKDKEDD
jgi:hypothetical protein